jgi:DNA-binding NarL/FixJ family response regulator
MPPETGRGIELARLPPAKVVIAADPPSAAAALARAVRAATPGAALWTVSTPVELQAAIAEHPDLDLALLDLQMPGARGFSALLLLRAWRPELPAIVIADNHHPPTIARAQQFGAAGFLARSAPVNETIRAIGVVLGGGSCFPRGGARRGHDDAPVGTRLARLTPQQIRVLLCVADGLLNKQIAHALRLAENTVKVHVTAVLRKLGCHTRAHAAVLVKALEAESTPYPFLHAGLAAAAGPVRVRRSFTGPHRLASGAVQPPPLP